MEQGASTLGQALIGQGMIGQASITAWILVTVAFFALGILVYVALRNRSRRIDVEKAVQAFRSLDIEAFKNLVDSNEEAFLRDNLSPRKFREIKRQRTWAAFLYAWETGTAATALARVGQAAQRSGDPETAASGVQLADNAFRLRLQTMRACLHLLGGILWPARPSQPSPAMLDHYERAAETLVRLGRFACEANGLGRSKNVPGL